VQHVRRELIPALLIELSKVYFRQLNPEKEQQQAFVPEAQPTRTNTVYQCPSCLTVYDEQYGDGTAGIPPGTSFEALPASYHCHVCEGPKKDFVAVLR
jgi:rubredoxin